MCSRFLSTLTAADIGFGQPNWTWLLSHYYYCRFLKVCSNKWVSRGRWQSWHTLFVFCNIAFFFYCFLIMLRKCNDFDHNTIHMLKPNISHLCQTSGKKSHLLLGDYSGDCNYDILTPFRNRPGEILVLGIKSGWFYLVFQWDMTRSASSSSPLFFSSFTFPLFHPPSLSGS